MMKKSIILAFLLIALVASASYSQTKRVVRPKKSTPAVSTRKKPVKYKKINKMENSNTITTESGLTITITKKGEGEKVLKGQMVSVNYTGLLTNGAMFDSSLTRNEPFSFPVGAGMVIKGWDEGLQNLRVGDHAILTIPPSIGYGANGAGGVIPPNATLVFIIEVLGVK